MAARRIRRSLLSLGLCAVPCTARAEGFRTEFDATLAAQFYSLRSPYGSPLVQRRRYTQTLALNLYDLSADRSPRGTELTFKSRLRLDSDFGERAEERNPDSSSFVPGLYEAPVDVMYAYLDGQRYFGGVLGFRLGRQYQVDSLGFWSFDGAEVSVTTPAYLAFEAYGGFEQRGRLSTLSTSRYEADGVWRGDRSGLAFGQSPSFLQETKLAPAYGFAVESAGLPLLHGRFSYRRVINRDAVLVSPFPDEAGNARYFEDDRTSSERLGGSLRVDAASVGAAVGSFVYDLYLRTVSQYDAGLDWYASERLVLGGRAEYFLPTFDADSIFNWFSHRGAITFSARSDVRPWRRLDISARAGLRRFDTEDEPHDAPTPSPDLERSGKRYDYFATLGGRYRLWDGSIALDTIAETGAAGHRYGGDITGRKRFDGGFYDSLVVLSLYDWDDALRSERAATSFSYVLGAGIAPTFLLFSRGRLGLEWEHTVNRLVGQRFRMLATLDFSVLR